MRQHSCSSDVPTKPVSHLNKLQAAHDPLTCLQACSVIHTLAARCTTMPLVLTLGGVLQFRQATGSSHPRSRPLASAQQLGGSGLVGAAHSHQQYVQAAALHHSLSPQRHRQPHAAGSHIQQVQHSIRTPQQQPGHGSRRLEAERPHSRGTVPSSSMAEGWAAGGLHSVAPAAAAPRQGLTGPQSRSPHSLFSDMASQEASGNPLKAWQDSSLELSTSSTSQEQLHSFQGYAAGSGTQQEGHASRGPRPARQQQEHENMSSEQRASPVLVEMLAELGQAVQQGMDR